MRARTVFRYLSGNREAILEIAANHRAIWVGLLLVFSAAFARDYDGEDLVSQPWRLLIPVVASLGASFLLFLVVCGPLYFRGDSRPPFSQAYRSFLGLFWLTAPLAWLYAIPYERFMTPADATRANLATLAFVAVWRVALMVRVTSVLTGRGLGSSFFLVMAFGDVVALAAVVAMPKPVIEFMGGVRTEREQVILDATFLVTCLGLLTAPVWGIGALIALFLRKPSWQASLVPGAPAPIGRGLWALAVGSVLFWLPILPFTQSEHILRTEVELLMRAGQTRKALDLMSAHAPTDFPPHWDPPPRHTADLNYFEYTSRLLDVMELVATHPCAPWVRGIYAEKLERYFAEGWYAQRLTWDDSHRDSFARIVSILERIPEGPEIARKHEHQARTKLESSQRLSEPLKDDLRRVLELAKR